MREQMSLVMLVQERNTAKESSNVFHLLLTGAC